MEIGKPDLTGEVGAEAIGSVSLPRPKSGWLSNLPFIVALAGVSLFSGFVQGALESNFGWTKQNAQDGAQLLQGSLLLAVMALLQLRRRRLAPIGLSITRGTADFTVGEEHFEIWSAPTEFGRCLQPLSILIAGIGATLLVTMNSAWIWQFYGMLGLLFLIIVTYNMMGSFFTPLLLADAHRLIVEGKKIPWEQIQRVEVEHLTRIDGSFESVKLSAIGVNERKLGQTALAESKLSATEERELLEFFARILGRRVLPVEPTSLDWM